MGVVLAYVSFMTILQIPPTLLAFSLKHTTKNAKKLEKRTL